MSKIKVVEVGCGKMAKYAMRYVFEKGAEVVGAVDINPEVIGKDISYVMGGEDRGVVIQSVDKLGEVLDTTGADIAIVMTMSLVNDVRDVLKTIVMHKVNAITTCEEAFYAENSNKLVFNEIDKLAKENGVTVTGCGYQDVFWGNLIYCIGGSTHNITSIKGSSSYNVEDYGIALADAHGAGLTLAEFDEKVAKPSELAEDVINKQIEGGTFAPSYMWNTVGWLADRFGYHITSISQKCVPMVSDKDIHSTTLNMDIPAGNATGMSAVVTAHTVEGVDLIAECIGKVYAEDEFDKNEWTVYGEPNTTITVNKPATVELTCADIVNRLPDVIKAESGFVPTSRMGEPTYRNNSLDSYL